MGPPEEKSACLALQKSLAFSTTASKDLFEPMHVCNFCNTEAGGAHGSELLQRFCGKAICGPMRFQEPICGSILSLLSHVPDADCVMRVAGLQEAIPQQQLRIWLVAI